MPHFFTLGAEDGALDEAAAADEPIDAAEDAALALEDVAALLPSTGRMGSPFSYQTLTAVGS